MEVWEDFQRRGVFTIRPSCLDLDNSPRYQMLHSRRLVTVSSVLTGNWQHYRVELIFCAMRGTDPEDKRSVAEALAVAKYFAGRTNIKSLVVIIADWNNNIPHSCYPVGIRNILRPFHDLISGVAEVTIDLRPHFLYRDLARIRSDAQLGELLRYAQDTELKMQAPRNAVT